MGQSRTHRVVGLPVAIAACLWAGGPRPAFSQSSRVALDTVIATDVDAGSQVSRKPTAWFDVFGAVRLAEGLNLRARPVVFRRSFDGAWQTQMYELALRYERPGAIGVRFDVGQFVSPIGLAILENRPNTNPVVSQHSTLYLPVPRFEAGTPTTFLVAASYPLGAQVTASAEKWDVRAAVTDSSPIRGRPFFGDNKPPRMVNAIVGGGVTPRIGLRLGAAVAYGPYAAAREVRDQTGGDRTAQVGQVEGEWSFGHTRIAGEWLWTRREMATDRARVDGGWIEATQKFGARWFAAGRYDDQSTKWTSPGPGPAPRTEIYRRLETTVGFRATPEITLRGSYMTRKGYVVEFWDDQVLASIVFARKLM
jgi:hypothetical protein